MLSKNKQPALSQQ